MTTAHKAAIKRGIKAARLKKEQEKPEKVRETKKKEVNQEKDRPSPPQEMIGGLYQQQASVDVRRLEIENEVYRTVIRMFINYRG